MVIKKMPFLVQEGHFQRIRRACSRIELGLFYVIEKHGMYARRVKIIDIPLKIKDEGDPINA